MKPLAYYITAHGYGHGTRSCDVLRALHRLAPERPVIVTTDLPSDFLASRLAGCANLRFRRGAFDVGLVQKDSLQSDLPATLRELEALYAREQELVEQERRFLEQNGVHLAVADIPAIPLAAAQQAGIHNIAIGNFSWDWIYEAYLPQDERWALFAEKFRAVYARTDRLLRLPFAPPMEIFPNRTDLPLLAAPGTERRGELAAQTGADPAKIWVLLSFTSLNLGPDGLENIRALGGRYEFFCVQPLDFPGSSIRSVDRRLIGFADILASCDLVISKPGFGLVSECIVNNKPLIYADRGDFAEYLFLVEGIEAYLTNVFLPAARLYAGDFGAALEAIGNAPPPPRRIGTGGAEQIARELLRYS